MSELELLSGAFRWILGVSLLLAGLKKLRSLSDFRSAVGAYELVGPRASEFVTKALPPIEVVCGVFILMRRAEPYVVLPAVALFCVFAGAIGINIVRGRRDLDCGCGLAPSGGGIGWAHVIRNILLACMAIAIALLLPSSSSRATILTSLGLAVQIMLGWWLVVGLSSWQQVMKPQAPT